MKISLLSALMASLFIATPVAAQTGAIDGRLQRIKETKVFVAGYREQSVPFSYLNDGKPTGYGVEITERVLAAVRQKLNDPSIKIRWNAVTLSTRIPLVKTNTIDINCATDTHTRARGEDVNFSTTFYISRTVFATPKSLNIKLFRDLQGKRLAVPAGTTVESKLRDTMDTNKWNITVIPARNTNTALQLMLQGKADAFGNAESLVAGEMFRLPEFDKYELVTAGNYQEAFACMLPKGDANLKKLVDEVLIGMMQSGEMEALFKKWFNQPIPPFGKSLNLPLNDSTRALFKAPNDTPLE
jgi:glutamate/aspartate transport system substrate-binding protein